ncbi:MAG: alpha-ketoglutarate-dependent dioxygenase AlkB, partial [Alphaproteobacteria bacterium]|nr:alpha-ketoglutarate-dependent dioxygenase AlkB [Alphaproteobacteria bacterium]
MAAAAGARAGSPKASATSTLSRAGELAGPSPEPSPRSRQGEGRGEGGDRALADLLSSLEPAQAAERLSGAAVLLRGFARERATELIAAVDTITTDAPFRKMMTPGGFRMSVGMTNCGRAGWVTDRKGYRYEPVDPITGNPWPPMRELFRRLAKSAALAGG